MTTTGQSVLVTGGSGFVAKHCIRHLLDHGFSVRTTVRSLGREAEVRAVLSRGGREPGAALSFVAADLTSDGGWAEAVDGCDYVLHVASPVLPGAVENEDDVIVPAREGALRVLRAARDGGVERVVITSAFHAIGFGYGRTDHVFTESDWTILDGPGVDAYGRSKTLAERAAWDFVAAEAKSLELVSINPVAVIGPVMGGAVSGPNEVVRRILDGALPGYPDFWMPIVDVRDVAAAHALAMITPAAAGQRFIVSSGSGLKMEQIGAIMRKGLGDRAKRVPTRRIPSFVLRIAARFDATARGIAPDLGVTKQISNDKARRVLGWQPRDLDQTIIDTAESMIATGVVAA